MKRLHIHTLTFLLAFLIAACASSAANTTTSGIYGQVLIGPLCPVVQIGKPCPDKPYPATITVLDQKNRRRVTQFQSDTQGQFKIGLQPGTYLLVPESPSSAGIPHAGEQTVTVSNNQFTQVTINYDSGIR